MKNILCFGDSNTWGYIPVTAQRYPREVRWPGKLQQLLGSEYYVIEAGLNGRTICHDEPGKPNRNGMAILPYVLESNRPLDIVIVMLGTNDLKAMFEQTAQSISNHIKLLCQSIQTNSYLQEHPPQILLVSPAHVLIDDGQNSSIKPQANHESQRLHQYYQAVSQELNIAYFDASDVVDMTNADGVHWLASQHIDFAQAICKKIIQLNP